MTAFIFLAVEDVLEIQLDQIQHYGGSEGIRDQKMLFSALAQPQSSMGGKFLHKNVYEMAAAYLFHLVQNHPFVDGNKRTGFLSALIFLSLNGVYLEIAEDVIDVMVLKVASSEMKKDEISKWFKARS